MTIQCTFQKFRTVLMGMLQPRPTLQRTCVTVATVATLGYVSFVATGNALRGSRVSAASVDLGDVSIVYRPVRDAKLQRLRQDLQRSRLFETVASDLNKTISLPRNVNVEFLECGSADAYYDGRAIGVCYELMQRYVDRFAQDSTSPEDAALHAGLFTLFHELGHLLIDQWNLPVTGREEDAVDEFAAIMLLEASQGEAALSGARQFAADAEDWDALPFWDDHGLDMQRFYNVSCYVYGSDPKQWASIVGGDWLPQERAESCPADYQQKSDAWRTLLQPYLKQDLKCL
jgi:hypothetical protein